jgi:hypothetical protein
MQNEIQPVTSIDSFISAMQNLEPNKQSLPRPAEIKLDGNTGKYSIRSYNQETKEYTEKDFGTQGIDSMIFDGSILLVKWFAQWKYKPETKLIIRTKEFLNFNDSEIELLKIDLEEKDKAKKTTVHDKFNSYGEFKSKYQKVDEITGAVSSPFDLWASIFLFSFAENKIVNYKFKGITRSNFFDYLKDYKNLEGNQPRVMAEAKTQFGTVSADKPDGSGKYFSGSFKTIGLNSKEEMQVIVQAFNDLVNWMNSFKNVEKVEVETELIGNQIEEIANDEIKLSDIPF